MHICLFHAQVGDIRQNLFSYTVKVNSCKVLAGQSGYPTNNAHSPIEQFPRVDFVSRYEGDIVCYLADPRLPIFVLYHTTGNIQKIVPTGVVPIEMPVGACVG